MMGGPWWCCCWAGGNDATAQVILKDRHCYGVASILSLHLILDNPMDSGLLGPKICLLITLMAGLTHLAEAMKFRARRDNTSLT